MKLLILSDLHLEFAGFAPDPAAVAQADVVVLAGDIGVGLAGTRWAQSAFPPDQPVLYVAGNHEFYGHDWDLMRAQLRQDCAGTQVHLLDRDEFVHAGVRFLGATLWTDFALLAGTPGAGGRAVDVAMRAAQRGLNDFGRIRHAGRAFTPRDSLDEHRLSRAWLATRLSQPHAGPTVVITHHAPSGRSSALQFLGDELSPCFASNLPEASFFGNRCMLWVHGHMHNSCDYPHLGARIVCNPRGYPRSSFHGPQAGFENPSFDAARLLELP